ncbi:MAG: AAA family ATPase [Promethearchaeota archaeon]|nr:MAG: AAA family ATPase [Candidatus Lokiarchaeota archaeon]
MSVSLPSFGYPRALYDPRYVPPILLHRTKEMNTIFNLFNSSLDLDESFNVNTYIYGIRGVGKTVFIRTVEELLKSKIERTIIPIYFNLETKSPIENLRLLVEEYSNNIGKQFQFLKNAPELWSYFQFLRKDDDTPLIILLDNVHTKNQLFYEKLIRYSNDLHLSTIATSSESLQMYKKQSKTITDQLNFDLQLDIYTPSALLDIVVQRISLAFPFCIDPDFSRFITDIVMKFDLYRPSTCIEILKSLHKNAVNGIDITSELIRDASYHLVEFPYPNELDSLLIFDDSEIDLFCLPLLQKISYFFNRSQSVYISEKQLFTLYKISCDEIEIPYRQTHFQQILDFFLDKSLLYCSHFPSNKNDRQFFLLTHPEFFLTYLETKFSENQG